MSEQFDVYGMWDKIHIYCLNHDDPLEHEMHIVGNTEVIKTPFYACDDYISLDKGAGDCANRLNLDDYQGIVLKFLDQYAENPLTDPTGTAFTYKGGRQKLYVRILHFGQKHIDIGVKNLTVLG